MLLVDGAVGDKANRASLLGDAGAAFVLLAFESLGTESRPGILFFRSTSATNDSSICSWVISGLKWNRSVWSWW